MDEIYPCNHNECSFLAEKIWAQTCQAISNAKFAFVSSRRVESVPSNRTLLRAVQNGLPEVVSNLLRNGEFANMKDNQGRTALICATQAMRMDDLKGDNELSQFKVSMTNITRLLLDYKADPECSFPETEEKPLHYAVKKGLRDVVAVLLKHGANVNALDRLSQTPLFKASDVEIAQLLLDFGASVNVEDFGSGTPLHRASSHQMAKFFLDNGTNLHFTGSRFNFGTALHGMKDPTTAMLLIRRGIDVNAEDGFGQTALHRVFVNLLDSDSKRDSMDAREIVELLLKSGANVNHSDVRGLTPLMIAAQCGPIGAELIPVLLQYGADAHARDIYNLTPLHRTKWFETAEILVKGGADLEARAGSLCRNALHGAVQQSGKWASRLVSVLLELGASVQSQDNDGYTALHLATSFGSAETVRLLLDGGADVNITTKGGQTPVELAKDEEIIREFRFHFVKLMAVGLHVNSENLIAVGQPEAKPKLEGKKALSTKNLPDKELNDFKLKCEEESRKFRSGTSGWRTLRDFLNIPHPLHYKHRLEVLNSMDKADYPIYGSWLKNKLKEEGLHLERRSLSSVKCQSPTQSDRSHPSVVVVNLRR